MRRRLSILVAAGCLAMAPACVLPVIAQESAHEGPHGEAKGEKHEGESGGNMMMWKWLNFGILAAGLGYLMSKNLGPFLAERSAGIREALAAGENAKIAAEARAMAVQVKLDGLAGTVDALKAEAKSEREHEAVRLRRETELELARISQHAAMEIESASKLARLELQRHAAKLAIDLATQKVKGRMTGDVQSALMDSFVGGLAASTAATADKSKNR